MPDFAVLDSSVIILIVAPLKDTDPDERKLRQERATETLRDLRKNVRFVIPAPARSKGQLRLIDREPA